MDHNWVIETIDSGYLGINDFWLCDRCGAGGGPVFFNEKKQAYVKRFKSFLPGAGLQVTDDCVKAQELIAEYRKEHPLCVYPKCTQEARTSGLCSTHFEEELEGYKEEAVDQLDNLTSPPDSKDK
jgi:hypothetical protein